MEWISAPITALVWIAGIAWIIERYILGVKVRFRNVELSISRETKKPPKSGVYLSEEEEMRREQIRASRESAIAKR